MNRAVLAVVFVLAIGTNALGQPPLHVWGAECFEDGTVVGVTEFGLAVLEGDQWQALSWAKGLFELWRSPDGRVFALGDGHPWSVVQVPEPPGSPTRWTIPAETGFIRFTSLDGIDVVTHDRIYRLDPGGTLTDLGTTPVGRGGQPLRFRAPEILVSGERAVVCTGTSLHEEDYVGGRCREARGAYVYRVDFEESDSTAPFVCGDAVISVVGDWPPTGRHDKTQARALATGALLGHVAGAAWRGSACLDGKRALLVGKRDIRVVSVPGLRTLWRQKLATEPGAVTVCGGTKAVVIPQGPPLPVQVFTLDAR